MSDLQKALGAAVRELRLERGWTQEDLADRSGLQPTYISEVERGKRNPALNTIGRLASTLGVRVAELFSQADG